MQPDIKHNIEKINENAMGISGIIETLIHIDNKIDQPLPQPTHDKLYAAIARLAEDIDDLSCLMLDSLKE